MRKCESRAKVKYCKGKTKFFGIRLSNEFDTDIIEHLQKQPNKNGYLKGIIRDDIKRSN